VYEEAVMADINLFCITLDGDSMDFMEDVFGNALIYLPDITELPTRLLEIFRKVTT
jgi:nitric oxide reductase activation protein